MVHQCLTQIILHALSQKMGLTFSAFPRIRGVHLSLSHPWRRMQYHPEKKPTKQHQITSQAGANWGSSQRIMDSHGLGPDPVMGLTSAPLLLHTRFLVSCYAFSTHIEQMFHTAPQRELCFITNPAPPPLCNAGLSRGPCPQCTETPVTPYIPRDQVRQGELVLPPSLLGAARDPYRGLMAHVGWTGGVAFSRNPSIAMTYWDFMDVRNFSELWPYSWQATSSPLNLLDGRIWLWYLK